MQGEMLVSKELILQGQGLEYRISPAVMHSTSYEPAMKVVIDSDIGQFSVKKIRRQV